MRFGYVDQGTKLSKTMEQADCVLFLCWGQTTGTRKTIFLGSRPFHLGARGRGWGQGECILKQKHDVYSFFLKGRRSEGLSAGCARPTFDRRTQVTVKTKKRDRKRERRKKPQHQNVLTTEKKNNKS